MAAVEEIAVKLGINVSDFKVALKDANASVKVFKKDGEGAADGFSKSLAGAQKGINTFKQVLAGAGLVGIVKGLTDAGIAFAEGWTGSFDSAVASTLRLKASGSDLGSIIQNVSGRIGVELVGFMEKAGVAAGAMVYGVDAASDALNALDVASKAAFDEARAAKILAAEERLAKVRAEAAGGVQKINFLLTEQTKLEAERAKHAKGSAEYIDATAKIESKRLEVVKELTSQAEKAEQAAKKVAEEREKAERDAMEARKKGFEDQAKIYQDLGKLYEKEADAHRESLTLGEQQLILLREEAQLERDLAGLEEGTIEYNETLAELLDVRSKFRKTETEAAKQNVELAKLLLVPEEKRTDIEKERIKLLQGETSEHQQALELQALLARGVETLTVAERNRLAVLAGVTAEIKKGADEAERQARALQTHFSKSITIEGNLQNLDNDALKELNATIQKQLSFEQSQTLTQRQDTVIEAGFKSQLAAIQIELDKRRNFEQLSRLLTSEKVTVRFGTSEFQRLQQLRDPNIEKANAQNLASLAANVARIFPEAAKLSPKPMAPPTG